MKDNIEKLFYSWDETIIWSCLQGIMGEIYTDSKENAAVAVLGDFAFYAGDPSEELVRSKPESCASGRMSCPVNAGNTVIMVPQNDAWAALIEKCHGDRTKRITRYALKKERDIFDVPELERAVLSLPEGYELKMIQKSEYYMCRNSDWSRDLVSQYGDYDTYQKLGLGVVAVKDKEPVSGASSYSTYDRGIEIEIDTREDHRRKGLAYACAAKLILECLKRGLYPSWDAHNKASLTLAEKLGYHFSHEYTAYETVINS